jgi:hypothetical protein
MCSRKLLLHASLFVVIVFPACADIRLTSPPLSEPFFLPAAEDVKRLSTLTRDLDTKAAQCVGTTACEDVHFARGLIGLFESREAARTSFRRVVNTNSGSPLASSSALWLEVLEDNGPRWVPSEQRERIYTALTANLVREWLDHQLAGLANKEKIMSQPTSLSVPSESKKNDPSFDPNLTLLLQRQVKERDHRIEELRSQLEALKVIDHDRTEQKKTRRSPASMVPKGDYGP